MAAQKVLKKQAKAAKSKAKKASGKPLAKASAKVSSKVVKEKPKAKHAKVNSVKKNAMVAKGAKSSAGQKPQTKKPERKSIEPKKTSKKENVKQATVLPPSSTSKGGKVLPQSKINFVEKVQKAHSNLSAHTSGGRAATGVPGVGSRGSTGGGKSIIMNTEASGAGICREVACELMATTGGYCRMHYIKNWKKIKRKELILKERKLNHYIEELISKYPDKYIDAIRQDLASEKDFAKVIADLEIDEGVDDFDGVETESAENVIDSIKREFEDDSEPF